MRFLAAIAAIILGGCVGLRGFEFLSFAQRGWGGVEALNLNLAGKVVANSTIGLVLILAAWLMVSGSCWLLLGARPKLGWVHRTGAHEIGRNLSIICVVGIFAVAVFVLLTFRVPLGQNGWHP